MCRSPAHLGKERGRATNFLLAPFLSPAARAEILGEMARPALTANLGECPELAGVKPPNDKGGCVTSAPAESPRKAAEEVRTVVLLVTLSIERAAWHRTRCAHARQLFRLARSALFEISFELREHFRMQDASANTKSTNGQRKAGR